MKLAYIANARMPSEKAHTYQIMKMCEAFALNGAKIDLILPFRFQTTAKLKSVKDYWRYYGIREKFKIVKLPSLDLIWIDSFTLRLSVWRSLLQHVSFALFATAYCLFKKADIYYTRVPLFARFFGMLKFRHHKKIYYESHQYEPPVVHLVKTGKVDGLVVITNKLKGLYTAQGIPDEKILVAPDGVDLTIFDTNHTIEDVKRELGIPPESKVIGYSGQLHTMGMEKGVTELVEAFKILRGKIDNLCLCFVGGPEEKIRQYTELVQGEGLKGSIIFAGQKPPYQVPFYMSAFDVCAMPFPWTEHYAYYMSPLKLFEYMASKRPIVASDLPSVREILNNENAVLVEPENPEALAEGIKKVLSNGEFGKRLADKAYEDVQEYSWEKRAKRILEFTGVDLL